MGGGKGFSCSDNVNAETDLEECVPGVARSQVPWNGSGRWCPLDACVQRQLVGDDSHWCSANARTVDRNRRWYPHPLHAFLDHLEHPTPGG